MFSNFHHLYFIITYICYSVNNFLFFSAGFIPITGGKLTGNKLLRSVDNDYLFIGGATNLNNGSFILLSGKNTPENGKLELVATNNTNDARLKLEANGTFIIIPDYKNNSTLHYDISDAAIVAKSFNRNSYIKYVSNLTIQWGILDNEMPSTDVRTINFPINFNNTNITLFVSTKSFNDSYVGIHAFPNSVSEAIIKIYNMNANSGFYWLAISY